MYRFNDRDYWFQSTRLWEARRIVCIGFDSTREFQSTRLWEARPALSRYLHDPKHVSIHAPVGGAT